MYLSHVRLPSPTPYALASRVQEHFVQALLSSKSSSSSSAASATSPQRTARTTTTPPPGPTILTAEFHPVYTCGRREIGSVSVEQQRHLRAGGRAEFHEARRGGQTTFHGPGQLVAYPIVDLRRHGLSPRRYVRVLEEAVIATLRAYGIVGFTTGNPGVWTSDVRKIAAVGVHLRRNVTSHGVGLNVSTDLWWFNRIVACGLEGMETTSLEREGVRGKTVEEVGRVFVREFARLIGGVEDVVEMAPDDLAQLMAPDLTTKDALP